MVSGPVVSPACGTLCSPADRASVDLRHEHDRGKPCSDPPTPKPTIPGTSWSSAAAAVSSAAGIPKSAGMSKIQRSSTPWSRSAATRASSIASRNASSGRSSRIAVYGVTVSSA